MISRFERLLRHLWRYNTRRLVLFTILAAVLITIISSSVLSLVGWGNISFDRFWVGVIEAVVAAGILAPTLINLVKKVTVEEETRRSDERYRQAFENSPIGIYRTTPGGKVLFANPVFITLLGYSSFEELASQDLVSEHFHPEYRREEFVRRMDREGSISGLESTWRRRDGSVITIRESARAIRGDDGSILYYEGAIEDITERKKAEQALEEREKDYRELFERAFDAILVFSPNNEVILDANERACAIYGIPREKFIGMSLLSLSKDPDRGKARVHEVLERGFLPRFETTHFRSDGSEIEFEINASAIHYRGRPAILSIHHDITRRKNSELQIRSSLKEKEVLLKEVHHRVKNNMQVISSLLRLQMEHVKDPRDATLFQVSQDRVRSMALIHEKLYRSESLAQVELQEYVRELADRLVRTYRTGDVAVDVHAERIQLGVDTAIPLGLIINELVSNALKHAFNGEKRGTIHIEAKSLGNSEYQLVVADNGKGLPPEIDHRNSRSLGLQIVSTLAEQLSGKVEVLRDGGTTYRIPFRAQ